MKLCLVFLVLFQVILITYAKPLEDKFAYIEKLAGGIKVGCYGEVKGTNLQITHYVVDSRGYRKILTNADDVADKMELTAKNGDPKIVGWRPLGEDASYHGYFPDPCFV